MTDKWLFVPQIADVAGPTSTELGSATLLDISDYVLPRSRFAEHSAPARLLDGADFHWPTVEYVYEAPVQVQPNDEWRALFEGDQLVYAYDGTGKCIGTVQRSTADGSWFDIVPLTRTWQSEGDDRTYGTQGGDQA